MLEECVVKFKLKCRLPFQKYCSQCFSKPSLPSPAHLAPPRSARCQPCQPLSVAVSKTTAATPEGQDTRAISRTASL